MEVLLQYLWLGFLIGSKYHGSKDSAFTHRLGLEVD